LAPYELCAGIARAATGSGRPLSQAQHAILLPRLLPGALLYGLLGLCFLVFNGRLAAWAAESLASARVYLAQRWKMGKAVLLSESRLHRASLLLAAAVGACLRLHYMGEPPRYDESATFNEFAGRSILHVLTLYGAPNNHVLHSLLAWASCRIFGSSPQALRLPALIAGIILIPLAYTSGRRLAGRLGGLFAAVLIAISGPLVLYSCNARGYMLQATLLMLMLSIAIDLATEPSRGAWLLFSAATIAGFWTAPTMLYSYLLAAGWLLWVGGRRMALPLVLNGAASAVWIVFLYMPISIVSGPETLLRNRWIQALSLQEFWSEAQRFPAEFGRFLHGGDPLLLPLALVVGILAPLLTWRTLGRDLGRLSAVLCLTVLIVSLVQRIVPYPRVLVPLFAVYYVIAAGGWSILGRRWQSRDLAATCGAVLLLGGGAWHMVGSGYIETYRYFEESHDVAAYLGAELRASDRLIVSLSAGPPVVYELRRLGVKYTEFSDAEPAPARVLVVTQRIDGPLPLRGDGLLDPFMLTLPGTLREAHLATREFSAPRSIYSRGRGQVFELTRLSPR
jgi:hypothetical protein